MNKLTNMSELITERERLKPHNTNLLKLLRLTREMMALADEGDRDRTDDSCAILYGVLRDSAYKLRTMAKRECENHEKKGDWR